MDIGLTVKQIRGLTPGNGYTDRQIAEAWPGKEIVKSGDKWWTNGSIVFFESAPFQGERTGNRKVVELAQVIGRMVARAKVRVYPVEVRDNEMIKSKRAIRFSDGNGLSVWADPKYVLALVTTKRVGKKKEGEVEWYADPQQPDYLFAKNGRRLGLTFGIFAPKHEAEWSFCYTGPFPDSFGNVRESDLV